jgi:hypothetical protein
MLHPVIVSAEPGRRLTEVPTMTPATTLVPLRLGPAVPAWWTAEDLLRGGLGGDLAAFHVVRGPSHAPTGLLAPARALEVAPASRRRWRLRRLAIPLDEVAVVGETTPPAAVRALLRDAPAHLGLVAADGDWQEVLVPADLVDLYRLAPTLPEVRSAA